jgi:GTP cyclohydrolase I
MQSKLLKNNNIRVKVSDNEAKKAVKTLLEWIGENPNREGLSDTPQRVIDSYKEYFSGYLEDPANILKKTFTETSGYQDMVLLKDIHFYSHCEHHIAPIKGVAHIAYYPNTKVVGISKLARIVEIYSKRLQIQERLTSEIANTINYTLKPKGVAVIIEASHSCINNRGINQKLAKMKTHALIGCFRNDPEISRRFFQLIS